MADVQQSEYYSGDIARQLLAHYDAHARTLPWRKPPGAGFANPYHVWLSEIMLQQTTVAAVGSYFQKFTHIWPSFAALAAAADFAMPGPAEAARAGPAPKKAAPFRRTAKGS